MTYLFRLMLALLCLTLPYTAAASALGGMGCHDAARPTMDVAQAAAKHAQHDTAQSTSFHRHAQNSFQHPIAQHMHDDCDCAKKCGCAQHCVSSCAVISSLATALVPWLPAYVTAAYPTNVPDLSITPLFRPPIAALS